MKIETNFITHKEAAGILGISIAYLYAKVKKNEVIRYKINGCSANLYKIEDLKELLKPVIK